MKKFVYLFSEGDATMRELLGGKGANLAEMTKIGLPVPQGFTVTTEACTQYYEDGRKINDDIQAEIMVKMFYNNANLSVSNIGRLDVNLCAMNGHEPTFAVFSGAAKKKNCAVASVLSVNGNAIISMCIQGTEKDKEMLDTFFNHMEESMKEIANN